MILTLIGIFDRKAQTFISIEATPNKGVALRSLTEIVNKPSDNPIHKWPDDFELYELGTFDTITGTPTPLEPKTLLCIAADLKQA